MAGQDPIETMAAECYPAAMKSLLLASASCLAVFALVQLRGAASMAAGAMPVPPPQASYQPTPKLPLPPILPEPVPELPSPPLPPMPAPELPSPPYPPVPPLPVAPAPAVTLPPILPHPMQEFPLPPSPPIPMPVKKTVPPPTPQPAIGPTGPFAPIADPVMMIEKARMVEEVPAAENRGTGARRRFRG